MIKYLSILFFVLLTAASSWTHEIGENYIFLEFHDNEITGRFEFRNDELEPKIGVNIYDNGKVSLEKIAASAPQVHDYINQNFSIGPSASEDYVIQFTDAGLFELEGGWAQYNFRIPTPGGVPALLHINHRMGYENDRTHRGVLVIEKGTWPSPGYKMKISQVYSSSNQSQILDTRNPPEVMTPINMIWQGVLHIWIGIDHILFLIALALPIVLVRDKDGSGWIPAPRVGKSLITLLKVVTVFTLAHSITLLLAGIGIINVPSRLVESVIALSIVLVALNNIFGRNHRTSLWIILLLGLFHGMGFASVMAELPFRIAVFSDFLLMIIGFNFGVELGQVAILLIVFPILFAIRNARFYSPAVLTGGSAALITVAGFWFIQRAFGI